MAIRHRRGSFDHFDVNKLLPGEFAVVLSGDPNATDGKGVYICLSAGDVQQLTTLKTVNEKVTPLSEDVERLKDEVENGMMALTNAEVDALYEEAKQK